jgi:hypothetical protein
MDLQTWVILIFLLLLKGSFFKVIDRFGIFNFGHCYLFDIYNLLFEISDNLSL